MLLVADGSTKSFSGRIAEEALSVRSFVDPSVHLSVRQTLAIFESRISSLVPVLLESCISALALLRENSATANPELVVFSNEAAPCRKNTFLVCGP